MERSRLIVSAGLGPQWCRAGSALDSRRTRQEPLDADPVVFHEEFLDALGVARYQGSQDLPMLIRGKVHVQCRPNTSSISRLRVHSNDSFGGSTISAAITVPAGTSRSRRFPAIR